MPSEQQAAVRAIMPAHLPRAIRRWVQNFTARGDVEDAPCTGRPHKVSHEVAKAAADEILAQHPVTVRQSKQCKAVRVALRKTGAPLRTLFRAMRHVYPTLSKTKLLEYKLPLTEEVVGRGVGVLRGVGGMCCVWIWNAFEDGVWTQHKNALHVAAAGCVRRGGRLRESTGAEVVGGGTGAGGGMNELLRPRADLMQFLELCAAGESHIGPNILYTRIRVYVTRWVATTAPAVGWDMQSSAIDRHGSRAAPYPGLPLPRLDYLGP
jgi:hypothetical protein